MSSASGGVLSQTTGATMNPQVRTKPDDTRGRIMETAEALFRRLGYAKTAVADIAAELHMSPANIYRFFSSKLAIVEAICQRFLGDVEEKGWAVVRSKAPASQRLERLVVEIMAFHRENLVSERRVNDIVMVAMEQSWDSIKAHKELMRTMFEAIVRDGIAAGEFASADPRRDAELVFRSLVSFCHPVLLADCMGEGMDVDAEARASVRFLIRALAPR
jgi:AcrR family transcriptional regulator